MKPQEHTPIDDLRQGEIRPMAQRVSLGSLLLISGFLLAAILVAAIAF